MDTKTNEQHAHAVIVLRLIDTQIMHVRNLYEYKGGMDSPRDFFIGRNTWQSAVAQGEVRVVQFHYVVCKQARDGDGRTCHAEEKCRMWSEQGAYLL